MYYLLVKRTTQIHIRRESPHGIVANVVDNDIIVSEFEHKSRYYIQF